MQDEGSVITRLRFNERRVTLQLLVLALVGAAAPAAHAQVVRGTVRDDASGAPLAGVVVSILHHRDGEVALPTSLARVTAGLTDAQGAYALAAGDSGHFVVTAKRIGVRQYVSPAIALARGETRQLDIRLEGVRYELPTVTVSTATPCGTRDVDRGRIAALWAEASAALTASELSLRDRLFHATIEHYQRVLDARTLSVRDESRNVRRSVTEHAFVSFPAESLSIVGYARAFDDGTIEHFAPDAKVLLSDSFVRDHCFGLAKPTSGEVGITFRPVRQRRVADIEGTIWLDARSYELHRVSFRYTNFPLPIQDTRTGGEVRFEHLAGGAWYVSRWYMRVPQVAMESSTSGTRRAPMVTTQRAVVASFSEVGGRVVADEQPASSVALATLNGRVIDSTGTAALADARVSLLGMSRATTTARDGAFKLDSIPPGNYTLLVEHPAYARLGLTAGEQSLEIGDAPSSITLVRAIDTPQILRQLCGYDEVPDTLVAMRIVLPKSKSGATDAKGASPRMLHLTWGLLRQVTPGVIRTLNMATDLPVDAAGGVTACTLPRDIRLVIEELNADGTTARQWQVLTPKRGFLVIDVGAD
ncbi:MAG: carboxypeptidase-like regulatory domain-containing protein [Gemmatimonadota bacterium]